MMLYGVEQSLIAIKHSYNKVVFNSAGNVFRAYLYLPGGISRHIA